MISSKKILCLTVAFLAVFVPFVANAQKPNPTFNPDPNTPTNRPPHPVIIEDPTFTVPTSVPLVERPTPPGSNPGSNPGVIMAQIQLCNGMLHFDFDQSVSVYSVILKHNGRQYGYYYNWTTMSLDVPFSGGDGVWDICVQTTDGRMYGTEATVSSGIITFESACNFIP